MKRVIPSLVFLVFLFVYFFFKLLLFNKYKDILERKIYKNAKSMIIHGIDPTKETKNTLLLVKQ
jgi:hypothetical protein